MDCSSCGYIQMSRTRLQADYDAPSAARPSHTRQKPHDKHLNTVRGHSHGRLQQHLDAGTESKSFRFR